MSASPLLNVQGITKRFGGIVALDSVDLDLGAATITSLVGPNGSGKTTLLDCLTGFTRADAGTVHFKAKDISRASRRRRIAYGIRRTFQAAHVFEGLTVEDHLLLAQQEADHVTWAEEIVRGPRLRQATKTAQTRAREALDLVELRSPPRAVATNLSYGQQKLLGLACGIVTSPDLLCLDEPLAGVNPALAARLVSVLAAVKREGTSLLIVEHNIEFVSAVSDQVVVLAEGQVVVKGPVSVLQDDARAFATLSGTADS